MEIQMATKAIAFSSLLDKFRREC